MFFSLGVLYSYCCFNYCLLILIDQNFEQGLSDMTHFSGEEFENEVRRICRNLYSNSIGQGSENVDGRERDGVFWNGDFFTIVEATTERKKEKALKDGKKTHDLVLKKRSEGNMARGFLVTLYEPTADQKDVVSKFKSTTKIISFDELRSQLFDSAEYIRHRSKRPFGSIYNHASHTIEVPRSDFVEPTITHNKTGEFISLDAISRKSFDSSRIIITAEYGMGKSMLLREIYFSLGDNFLKGNSFRTPVAINLRDHLGQSDHIELLERHARNTAIDARKLVAAWSAGYVNLIIDGFDELSTRGWTGDHRKLREFKRSTHSVVKKLIKETPKKSSIIISGRAAYFDSDSEMREALGAHEDVFDHFHIQHFDAEQASELLRRKNHHDPLPQWLPTRPLFLSYLINKDLIKSAVTVASTGSFPEGTAWSALLEMIAERESDQSEGVDKNTILQFWGLLATKARQGTDLQKSFSPTEMDSAFYLATGNTVSEDERHLLLRLPGFGVSPDNASNRIFIDMDFLNAASSKLVFSHIISPYTDEQYKIDLRNVSQQLNHVGVSVVCSLIESSNTSYGILRSCFQKEMNEKNYQLSFDIFMSIAYMSEFTGESLFESIEIDEIDLCQETWENLNIRFYSCLISRIILPPDGPIPNHVRFEECLIGTIDGRASEKDLPKINFTNCEINDFSDSYSVNSSILNSELSIGIRVLVVTLKKVYSQSGISRLESALLRGLDHRARMIVPDVIEKLKKHEFLVESGRQGKTIFAGTRSKRKEALAIIESPATYQAQILDDCRKIS